MVFAPIIFATVVLGIARMESLKELGRVGVRALIYFEVLSTVALAIGLIVVNFVQPGTGMNVDPAQLDTKSISSYTASVGSVDRRRLNRVLNARDDGEDLHELYEVDDEPMPAARAA